MIDKQPSDAMVPLCSVEETPTPHFQERFFFDIVKTTTAKLWSNGPVLKSFRTAGSMRSSIMRKIPKRRTKGVFVTGWKTGKRSWLGIVNTTRAPEGGNWIECAIGKIRTYSGNEKSSNIIKGSEMSSRSGLHIRRLFQRHTGCALS